MAASCKVLVVQLVIAAQPPMRESWAMALPGVKRTHTHLLCGAYGFDIGGMEGGY